MSVELPNAPAPDPRALALVRRVLDGLLGTQVPLGWDDKTYALRGTGRGGLTDDEQSGRWWDLREVVLPTTGRDIFHPEQIVVSTDSGALRVGHGT